MFGIGHMLRWEGERAATEALRERLRWDMRTCSWFLSTLIACGSSGGGSPRDSALAGGEPLSDYTWMEAPGVPNFGRDLALGDLDGDGDLDLAVSVSPWVGPSYTFDDGALVLFDDPLGSGDAVQMTLSLAHPDRIRTVGDLDGDGATDLFVQDLASGSRVYGSALVTVLLQTPDLVGQGCGCDLSGDGQGDVAIAGEGPDPHGTAYAFDGSLRGPLDSGDAFASVPGNRPDCGDLDGDGAPDLLVGNGHDQVAIHPGPLSGAGAAAGTWTGDAEDSVGFAVRVVTDVDGDGVDDALATSLFAEDRSSVVHLLSGSTTGEHGIDEAHARIVGHESLHFLGWSLDDAGDLDGDGHGDLVLASIGWGSTASVTLQFYGPVQGAVTVEQAARLWVGEEADYAGEGIAFGDVDGDGATDLLLGAPGASRVYQILDL